MQGPLPVSSPGGSLLLGAKIAAPSIPGGICMLTWNEAALADNYNKSVARWADAYYELEARFYALRDDLYESRKSVDRLSSRLIQTSAHAQGLGTQVDALKDALGKVAPSHVLFQKNPNGKTWSGGAFKGQVVSNVGLEYIRGFEEALVRGGVEKADMHLWYLGGK